MSAPNPAASSGRPRLTATMSQEGESISAGATRLRTMSPAPIKPQRSGSDTCSYRARRAGRAGWAGALPPVLQILPILPLLPGALELQLHGHLHLTLGRAAQRARR